MTNAQGATYYYTQDGQVNVRSLTDALGNLANRNDYTAFGEAYTANSTNTIANRYSYTGSENRCVANAGAPKYYRWRMYQPQVGRFDKRDPIGYYNGTNIYLYVGGKVTLSSDAFGLTACEEIIYVGHNGDVPQGTKENPAGVLDNKCSAYAVYSCGKDASREGVANPAIPTNIIPDSPAPPTGKKAFVIVNSDDPKLKDMGDDYNVESAYRAALKNVPKICQKDCKCTSIQVEVKCVGSAFQKETGFFSSRIWPKFCDLKKDVPCSK